MKQYLLTVIILISTLSLMGCQQTPVTSLHEKHNEDKLIPVASFFNNHTISHLNLSPDGKWLAFTKDWQGANNIYLVPRNKNISDAFAITKSKEPITEFQWSKNNNELFFQKDNGGDENTQIYHLIFSPEDPSATITINALTHNPKVKYLLIGQVEKSPNRLVVFANHDVSTQNDIFHLEVNTKKISRVAENRFGFNNISVNKLGFPVAAIANNLNDTKSLYVQKDGEWQVMFTSATGESISLLNFDEDNQLIYLQANIQGKDKQALMSYDIKANTFNTIHKDPNNQSDVHSVLFNDNNQPTLVSYYGGHLRSYILDKKVAQHWHKIKQNFGDDVEITIVDIDEELQQWHLHIASDVLIGKDYLYDEQAAEFQPLLAQKQSIDPDLLSKRKSITYLARDGIEIQAYLTLPKGKTKNLPTIVLPHGGPWARDYWTLNSGYFNTVSQLLANRGYAVLQPNFRASTGFGKRFINLGNKNWGTGTMQHDLTDGIDYLVNAGITDKERVGIFGGSYGGYAALAGLTFTPKVYQAAVSFVGPSSLITLINSFPAYFRPYLGQFFMAVGDPLKPKDVADMQARSPINFIDNIEAPLLLLQGANDPRVTEKESENIAKAMKNKNLAVEYLLAKDEGHGFKKRNNKLASLVAVERFFAKHLGGLKSDDNDNEKEIEQQLNKLTVDVDTL